MLVSVALPLVCAFTLNGFVAHDVIRRAPQMQEAASPASLPPKPLPPLLEEWGCDDELWSKIKNKRSLEKLARDNEEEHARKRIESLRATIAASPPPAPRAATSTKKRDSPKKSKAPVRKDGPYELFGKVPDETDVAAIQALVDQRAAAKLSNDYAAADEIRIRLKETMGVTVRDDLRTWHIKAEDGTIVME
jgi:hypothetical protein